MADVTAQKYYDELRLSYLNHRNDENAKCKEFRITLERFFEEYVEPELPDTATFAERQAVWYQRTFNRQLNKFLSDLRVDLNHIVHGDKTVKTKAELDYYFKSCVTVVYLISGEDADAQTKAAYGDLDEDYLKDLNEQQRSIVLDPARIVYVNAGPGSGKTHLLVYKIIDTLTKQKKDANIVAMSYTRSSAASLSAKLTATADKLNLLRDSIPYSGTIHSYCLNCMKDYKEQGGQHFDYSIADDAELEEIVDDIYYGLDGLYDREIIDNAVRNPKEIEDDKLKEVIGERKDIYNRITVGQILNVYYEELSNNEDFVKWSAERMNYLLVDEAQDLTIENYQIFDLLLEKIPDLKIFLVGDPRQNIFGFLGGSYAHLDKFLEKYDGQTSRQFLSYSYRCPQKVLDYTNTMEFQDCENVQLQSKSDIEGNIWVKDYDDEYEEARSIVKFIKERQDFANTAILAPRLKPLSKIVNELNDQGIAFVVKGGSNSIKPHIQAFNCMNKYVETKGQGIGAANGLCEKLEIPKVRTIPEFRKTDVGAKLEALNVSYNNGNITYLELSRKFVALCRTFLPEGDRKEQDEDFKKLFNCVISKADSPRSFSLQFKCFRKQFESREVDFKSTGTSTEAVTISTIHSAKGLEWDCVVLPCMSDNYFPNKKMQDSVNPEERLDGMNSDKKLLFVAVTRTKKDLFVTYPVYIRDSRSSTRASRLLGKLALM